MENLLSKEDEGPRLMALRYCVSTHLTQRIFSSALLNL